MNGAPKGFAQLCQWTRDLLTTGGTDQFEEMASRWVEISGRLRGAISRDLPMDLLEAHKELRWLMAVIGAQAVLLGATAIGAKPMTDEQAWDAVRSVLTYSRTPALLRLQDQRFPVVKGALHLMGGRGTR